MDDLILRALIHIIEQNDRLLSAADVYHESSQPLLEEIRAWMRDTHYSAQR